MARAVPTKRPVRILHISDLHFGSTPKYLDGPDLQVEINVGSVLRVDDRGEAFIRRARQLFQTPESRPHAIIVSGDLVESGGAESANGIGEFDRAVEFLINLADTLHLDHRNVLVVPGNHDIDWSKTGSDRYGNYLRAITPKFTSPQHRGDDQWEPVTVQLSSGDVEVEVTLLASPLLSGVEAPWSSRADRAGTGAPADALAGRLELVDIPVLGTRQCEYLARQAEEGAPGATRVAVLHHHLLPHTQLEVKAFESVLDSGLVLESLAAGGFDLVLSGHKHSRRFQRITLGTEESTGSSYHLASSVDLYNAPSLFLPGPNNEPPGFTLIDVYGPDEPDYAVLLYHDLAGHGGVRRVTCQLPRRIVPVLQAVVRDISAEDQERFLVDALQAFAAATRRRDLIGRDLVGGLFARLAGDILDVLEELGQGEWVLRHPKSEQRWTEFLSAVAARPGTGEAVGARVASLNDLRFWERALRDPGSQPARYQRQLGQLPGEKHRILILSEAAFRTDADAPLAGRVIDTMTADGFTVSVVDAKRLQYGPRLIWDFGIIPDLVVWTFNHLSDEAQVRDVILDFNRLTLSHQQTRWYELVQEVVWSSVGGYPPFLEWAGERER